ncbi:MAG TPA: nucleotidyltransferase family protein [Clostridia bacterium]|nr:nucleotidyltransferase family protein [Clostridia bacterium]
MDDVSRCCVSQSATLRQVLECIDRNTKGIALVVDDARRLLATVTDGDMRRAVLGGRNLDSVVGDLVAELAQQGKVHPVVAKTGIELTELIRLMRSHRIRQVPLLDDAGHVVSLAVLDSLLHEAELPPQAVVMAGGYGNRLMPLTSELPKPLLPVGDKPLLERVIEQLRQAGIRKVNVSTHYQSEKIAEHFGNGEAFGVDLQYVTEDRPLGTAGGLSLLQGDDPLLVVNGDILTKLDFRSLVSFHHEQHADMTVAVREFSFDVPYGVVECDSARITRVSEKPKVKLFINAGIYLLSPQVRKYIPNGERFDMTQLIQKLLDAGRSVVSFPVWEYWLDIGRHEDYEQAQQDAKAMGAAR